jgi:hypothetical protein
MGVVTAISSGARAARRAAHVTSSAAESAATKAVPVLESVPRERGGFMANADRAGYGASSVIVATSGAAVTVGGAIYGMNKVDHIEGALVNATKDATELARALEEKGGDLTNGIVHAFDGVSLPGMPLMPSVGASSVGISIVVVLAGVSVVYLLLR